MLHTIWELRPCTAGLQSVRIKTRFIIFSDLADNQKDFRDTHAVLK